MADDKKPLGEPYGSSSLKSFHKSVRQAMHTGRKTLDMQDHPGVKQMLDEGIGAMDKMCSGMRKAYGKWYPKHKMDDDEAIDSSFDAEDAPAEKAVEGGMDARKETEGGVLAGGGAHRQGAQDAKDDEAMPAVDREAGTEEGSDEIGEEDKEAVEKALVRLEGQNQQIESILSGRI